MEDGVAGFLLLACSAEVSGAFQTIHCVDSKAWIELQGL